MNEAEIMEPADTKLEAQPSLEARIAQEEPIETSDKSIEYNGERVYGEGASIPTHFIGKKSASKKSSKTEGNYSASEGQARHTGRSTGNGTVALIYNEDTGEVAFEQKFPAYSEKAERGKLQCIGGHIEEGESSLESLVREIEEEITNSSVVIKALKEKGYYFCTQSAEFRGKPVFTDFYVIPLSNSRWKEFVEGGLKGEGTGNLRIMPGKQAQDLDTHFYAFKSGHIVKDIISTIEPRRGITHHSSSHHNLYSGSIAPYAPSTIPMPIQNNYLRTISNN